MGGGRRWVRRPEGGDVGFYVKKTQARGEAELFPFVNLTITTNNEAVTTRGEPVTMSE